MNDRTTSKARRSPILIRCDRCGVMSHFPLCTACIKPWVAQMPVRQRAAVRKPMNDAIKKVAEGDG